MWNSEGLGDRLYNKIISKVALMGYWNVFMDLWVISGSVVDPAFFVNADPDPDPGFW